MSHLNHEPSFGYRCYRQWLLNTSKLHNQIYIQNKKENILHVNSNCKANVMLWAWHGKYVLPVRRGVRVSACMHAYKWKLHACMHACIQVKIAYKCMHEWMCMYVCMCVCMYVCMYVCMHMYIECTIMIILGECVHRDLYFKTTIFKYND